MTATAKASDRARGSPTRLVKQALRLIENGDFELAVRRCNAALKINKKHIHARVLLARALIGLDRTEEAAATLRALAADRVNGVNLIKRRAAVEMRKGDHAVALLLARTAHDLAPDDFAVGRLFARVLILNQHFEEAVSTLEDLRRKHPEQTEIEDLLGRALLALAQAQMRDGHYELTISTLERLSQRQPEHPKITPLMARALYRAERRTAAGQMFRDLLAESQGDPATTIALAQIEVSFGHADAAKRVLDDVNVERASGGHETETLALLEHNSGNYDIACRLWQKGLSIEPGSTTWTLGLAASSLRQGRFEDALRLAEQAAQNAEAHNWLLPLVNELQTVARRELAPGGQSDEVEERLVALRSRLLTRAPDADVLELLDRTRQLVLDMRAKAGPELAGGGGPRVSFICPLHRPTDLANLAAQVARQTLSDAEAVVAVHSAQISAADIRARWTAGGPLKILDCDQLPTLGAVLKAAVDASAGDLIMKIDADDAYLPNYASDMRLSLIYTGADIVVKKSKFRYYTGRDALFLGKFDWIDRPANRGNISGGSAICGWKRVFDQVPFDEDLRLSEDVNFLGRSLAHGSKIYFVDPFNHVAQRSPMRSAHSWQIDDLLMPFMDRKQCLIGDRSALHFAEV